MRPIKPLKRGKTSGAKKTALLAELALQEFEGQVGPKKSDFAKGAASASVAMHPLYATFETLITFAFVSNNYWNFPPGWAYVFGAFASIPVIVKEGLFITAPAWQEIWKTKPKNSHVPSLFRE